ncbi:SAM-dependent methyltransferase [Sphingobacterium pedocola]|uniref:Phytanoyl-CoA dioxygenase n=1 Tax=Sphingobacterium pedocola TaxID=2082722 RepID=A0ABR9T1P4_9SPHI|nr:hypothetical protein [Sphingobacterium pedocola]MBE8719261.1 hypothetical protein [Sphingobacterium pedocola]
MTSIQEKLSHYTKDILFPLGFHAKLAPAITGLTDLLFTLHAIAPESEDLRTHLSTKSGNAIGPLWAALCIKEVFRTQRFIQATHQAIQDKLAQKEGPIQIIYAGTGPFATLALPLMSYYTSTEVQFTLLEINQISFDKMEQTINLFGFEDYVNTAICADASTWHVPADLSADIVLSETMYNGLYKEPQVGVMLNFATQTDNSCIFIPEEIKVDLVSKPLQVERVNHLDTLITFNRAFMNSLIQQSTHRLWEFPIHRIPLPALAQEKLYLATEITIYRDFTLKINDSSLNLLRRFHIPLPTEGSEIVVQYQIKEIPAFEVVG